MAQAKILLKEKDRTRLLWDRLFKMAVTAGGVGVLAALVLIFVYLGWMVLPLFADAKFESNQASLQVTQSDLVSGGIDDHGKYVYLINEQGQVDFWSLDQVQQPALQQLVVSPHQPYLFAKTPNSSEWYAFSDAMGNVTIFSPKLNSVYDTAGRVFTPRVDIVNDDITPSLVKENASLSQFGFSHHDENTTLAGQYSDGKVRIVWKTSKLEQSQFEFAAPFNQLDQILITPDGETVYLRSGSELVVVVKQGETFTVREVVDLSQHNPNHQAIDVQFLSGAHSLLVAHTDGRVSQWFDVLTNERRQLTAVRDFKLPAELTLLLPDTFRKGFYSFYPNGTVQSHYTTSEKLVLFERAYSQSPKLVAMSGNERFVLSLFDDHLDIAVVDKAHPEVSWSSLWRKVWYESYPEPEFVWQTTSSSDEYEPKFSIVPIAFGTIKAAMYAMLFAIPIAVLGAIYTAYFMTPKMRRVVKPSIELMEALPTVIIGFLAGLWFAPIVESYLAAVVALLIILPISTLVMGAAWHSVPATIRESFPNGWHAILLMPLFLAVIWLAIEQSGNIETWLFAGDVRVFLAEQGIDYDQRNALVVGFAMGFAVIPTIFTIAEDAIFSVPKHLSDGSLALGATQWQTLLHVVLLTASPGIFSAIMIGLGRAVGETMIVLMATGNTPLIDWNILEGMRTLSATIAVEMPESEVGSSHYRILFLGALLLLMFTFAVNSVAEWVRQRLRERYRAL